MVLAIMVATVIAATAEKVQIKVCRDLDPKSKDYASVSADCIKMQSAAVTQMMQAAMYAWNTIGMPSKVLDSIGKLDFIREDPNGIQSWAPNALLRISMAIEGESASDQNLFGASNQWHQAVSGMRRAVVEMIRQRYSDPEKLKEDYVRYSRAWIMATLKSEELLPEALKFLDSVDVVLKKTPDLALARDAQELLLYQCENPIVENRAFCDKRRPIFEKKFKAHYEGAEPNTNQMWVLGFLQRRERDGQMTLVATWQLLLLSLGQDLRTMPAQ